LEFPERVYTEKEVKTAREMVNNGYKHNLTVEGSPNFEKKVNETLELIKTAGYYEFFRTYIRKIREIDGLTQLRETEVAIWANKFAVENPVDAASLFIQKAHHMKEYLEGEVYYGGNAETRSVEKRIQFLEVLKEKSQDESVKKECARLLKMWADSSTAF
jgi:predicted small secreted protein